MILDILRLLTAYYPFRRSRYRLLTKLLPNVPMNFGTIKAKNKVEYAAYPCGQDYIVKNLSWFGDFERWVTSTVGSLLQPGEIVCDIGANIGDTALQILPYLGSSGHIYCFEPVPLLQTCLVENLRANHISCITLVPTALSNSSGQLIMMVEVTQPRMSKVILEDNSRVAHEQIEVEMTTFDIWAKENHISHVAVCKVDVEGHELEVFEGMKNDLNAGQIGSIVFERHEQCDHTDPMIKLLCKHNYKVFRIYTSLLKTVPVELADCCTDLWGTPDYVAVLAESIFEARLCGLNA
jgi:FkbM family methyltransferase